MISIQSNDWDPSLHFGSFTIKKFTL
jgi:hypothetical protein